MKLSVETKALAEALRVVGVATAGRTTLPILEHVRLEATNGKLRLSCTDLDLFISETIKAEIQKEGSVSVPNGLLSRLASRVQSSRITLTDKGKIVEVVGGDVSAQLETLPVNEFPSAFAQDENASVECDAKDLTEPFRMLAHAIGSDQARYTLMGINIAPSKSGTDFAATTGVKLATFHAEHKLTDLDVIVPDSYVRAILKIQPSGQSRVTISDSVICLATNGTEISGKLIEGTYPNYRQVIPKNGNNVFACDRKDLINAVTTCAIFTEKGFPGLDMTGKGKHVEIAKPPKATARILGSELTGQPDFSIRFHSRHLLDTLSVMSGEDVRIACSDANSPFLIQEGQFKAVLVPVAVAKQ
jgi:DNA polymerase-3 subunit beta